MSCDIDINQFPWITEYTPVIPKIYWDVYSQEERYKWLCLEYDKIMHYLADTIKYINDNEGKYDNDIDTLYDLTKKLGASLDNVIAQLDKIVETLPVYDPTQGKNVTSREAMRNMFRELAVFGARANQMATLTAEQAAATTCLEMAVIGNKTVFGNPEPRVTQLNEPIQTPPPKPLTVDTLRSGIIINKYYKER